ncbi:MAG: hypothetical protein WD426_04945 [Anditalea sp.]
MKQNFTAILLSGAILFLSSCAGNVSKSNIPVSINSMPSVANLTIIDKKGMEVYKGNTPSAMKLKDRAGFLSKDSYQVTFEKEGYDTKTIPVEFKLDGWYFGNILFGGDIGLLIVDPVNGAMYKLEPAFYKEKLILTTASIEKEEFKIFGINEIPSEWKRHLVSLDH